MLTQKCIICRKKAEIFTGHLHDNKKKRIITSGFCEKHKMSKPNNTAKYCEMRCACFGKWKKVYGLKRDILELSAFRD
jgi:hypothetical protein